MVYEDDQFYIDRKQEILDSLVNGKEAYEEYVKFISTLSDERKDGHIFSSELGFFKQVYHLERKNVGGSVFVMSSKPITDEEAAIANGLISEKDKAQRLLREMAFSVNRVFVVFKDKVEKLETFDIVSALEYGKQQESQPVFPGTIAHSHIDVRDVVAITKWYENLDQSDKDRVISVHHPVFKPVEGVEDFGTIVTRKADTVEGVTSWFDKELASDPNTRVYVLSIAKYKAVDPNTFEPHSGYRFRVQTANINGDVITFGQP